MDAYQQLGIPQQPGTEPTRPAIQMNPFRPGEALPIVRVQDERTREWQRKVLLTLHVSQYILLAILVLLFLMAAGVL